MFENVFRLLAVLLQPARRLIVAPIIGGGVLSSLIAVPVHGQENASETRVLGYRASAYEAYLRDRMEFDLSLVRAALQKSPDSVLDKHGATEWARDVFKLVHNRGDGRVAEDLVAKYSRSVLPHQRIVGVPEMSVIELMGMADSGIPQLRSRHGDLERELKTADPHPIWIARFHTAKAQDRSSVNTWTAAANAWGRTLLEGEWKEVEARFLFHEIKNTFLRDAPASARKSLVDFVLKETSIDRWLAAMIEGHHEIRIGWEARGEGFADTVSDRNQRLFGLHLQRAEGHFTYAWQLRPDWPEAATGAISAGRAGTSKLREDVWFQRATEAAWDWRPARQLFVSILAPKWGGSVENSMQFAMDCALSGPPDEDAALILPQTVISLLDDTGRPPINEAIYDALREILRAHLERDVPNQRRRSRHAARLALFAWLVDDWEAVRYATGILQSIDTSKNMAFGKWFGTDARTVVTQMACAELEAMTPYLDARNEANNGNIGFLRDAIGRLEKKASKDADAARAVREFRALADAAEAEKEGEWISLSPAGDLSAWRQWDGQFIADRRHTILGRSTVRRSNEVRIESLTPVWIESVVPLPHRVHFTATIRWTAFEGEPGVQLWTSMSRPYLSHGVRVTFPREHQLDVNATGKRNQYKHSLEGVSSLSTTGGRELKVTLHVIRWDDELLIVRDDLVAFRGSVPDGPHGLAGDGHGIELIGRTNTTGWIEWSDLRLCALKERPEALDVQVDEKLLLGVPDIRSLPIVGVQP